MRRRQKSTKLTKKLKRAQIKLKQKQDRDVSFQEDIDDAIDTTEKEEDWIEYMKRSTKEAEDYMKKMKFPCWTEIHRRLKWRKKKDGPETFSIGILDLTTKSRQEDW